MQWLAQVCVHRPVFALMLIAAVVVAGAASYEHLGIDRFPNIDLPTIRVMTTYPGAASAEVESEVTQPLEDAVATVAGIDELRSISNDGVSMLMITFRLDQSINVASQDVRDAIAGVLNRLPPDIDPPVVQKQDLDASPIMTVAASCFARWMRYFEAPMRAMPTRSLPSRYLAYVQPLFSSPIRFSTGTRTSSKKTSLK